MHKDTLGPTVHDTSMRWHPLKEVLMLDRRHFTALALGVAGSLVATPKPSYALTNDDNKEVGAATTPCLIAESQGRTTITDPSNGDMAVVENDFVYIDGELVLDLNNPVAVYEPETAASQAPLRVPAGFKYYVTHYYGEISNTISLTASIVGLGLPAGIASAIASGISIAAGVSYPVYMSNTIYMKSASNPAQNQYYWILRFYKNSNYTGACFTYNYGPFYGNRPS